MELTQGVRFDTLELSPEILRALMERNIVQSTPVQAGCIPPMLEWRDVIAKAPTGTGKTVISALDYKRSRKQNPDKPCCLLFVAHREEILKQSLYTFRAVLKDANFGELFVGNYKPESIDNLFLSFK